jgi:hypothetical protein
MIDEVQKYEKRDRRILISIALLFISAASLSYQAIILKLYIDAAVTGHWTYFSETFSVPLPSEPNQLCFDYCASKLPFFWGWVGIVSFILGVLVLIYSWWKPQSSRSR